MPWLTLQQSAIPAVTLLICVLAYPSQWVLHRLDPGPLTGQQSLILHVYAVVILLCYYRACFTDPGRIPKDFLPQARDDSEKISVGQQRQRWCRKCQASKPPRAHHCKSCGRCIPKMDHHCPWTANCVSHTTFPHFIRFLFYAVIGMSHLGCLLWSRMYHLWTQRNLPSYMGPEATDLFVLFTLVALNSLVDFALFVLLVRSLWCLGANTTTIEGWEIERHETLLRRARYLGGFLEGPNGVKMRITRQEFPWDIGIFSNIAQGMGSKNPISWLWPLSRTPTIISGLSFEDNELEAPGTSWPPPDPDRMFQRPGRNLDPSKAFTQSLDPEDFRKRQEADQLRYTSGIDSSELRRRQPFHIRYSVDSTRGETAYADDAYESNNSDSEEQSDWKPEAGEGEEAWRNSEGERLKDFGVDEDAEFYDEDDVPLAKLMKRKKLNHATGVE